MVDFTIENEVFDPQKAKIPQAVQRAMQLLDNLPDGKLLLSRTVADRIGLTAGSWEQDCNHPALRDYKVKAIYEGNRKNLFGNRSTIEAYKEQVDG